MALKSIWDYDAVGKRKPRSHEKVELFNEVMISNDAIFMETYDIKK